MENERSDCVEEDMKTVLRRIDMNTRKRTLDKAHNKFKCTRPGSCMEMCCVRYNNGFHKCEYLIISSDVKDEHIG